MGLIESDPSTPRAAYVDFPDWWLKDVDDPANNVLLHYNSSGQGIQRVEVQSTAVYNPIGRKYPVVVSDAVQGIRQNIRIDFLDDEESYQKLRTLFGLQKVLLLQSGWLEQNMYIRFQGDWQEYIDNVDPPYKVVTLDFVEQEKPA